MDSDDEAPELIAVPSDDAKVVPVTLLSGFLGSGKTTLLNHILTSNHGRRIAVIENEFSDGLGIESMIAKSGVDGDNISNFFEMPNGCICCTLKDDLLTTLEQLVIHKDRFDYIVIETTGLANPGPVISTFWTDDGLNSCLKLDGVVCVVDSLNISQYLGSSDISGDVQLQMCYADKILLNKADLVNEETLLEVERQVRAVNALAEVQRSTFAKVNLDFVLNINKYSSDESGGSARDLVSSQLAVMQCIPCGGSGRGAAVTAGGSSGGGSAAVNLNSAYVPHIGSDIKTHGFKLPGVLDKRRLELFLDALLYSGFSAATSDGTNKHQETQSAAATTAAPAGTDSSGGVSVAPAAAMEVYRMKGILHFAKSTSTGPETGAAAAASPGTEPLLHILQAVHNLFELRESSYAAGGPQDTTGGQNLFVVIGKRLDAAAIEEGLRSCLVSSTD